jgi:predicted nucleic-acid-binding protein
MAEKTEEEIFNNIATFEKILEGLPKDQISLEALAGAYEKIGDTAQAKKYLLRLANVLLEQGDEDSADDLLPRLKEYDQTDPEIKEIVSKIEHLEPEKIRPDLLDQKSQQGKISIDISAEITFAWNLLKAKKITQEQYSTIIQDLTENSIKNIQVPVSTLHVLSDRTFSNFSSILIFAAKDTKTPLISLTNFAIEEKSLTMFPYEFALRHGVLVFDFMGNDPLIALLNPYNNKLKTDIQDLTGESCHFYLVKPAEFDNVLSTIREKDANQK